MMGERATKVVKCSVEGCESEFKVDYYTGVPGLHATHCDNCVEKMRILDEKAAAEEFAEKLLKNCGIPERFRAWDNEKSAKLGTEALINWIRLHRNSSVYIIGDNQQGKSHTVGFCAYRLIMKTSARCWFIHLPRWLKNICDLRRGTDNEKRYAESMTTRAKKVPLLVMDDIGNGKITEAQISVLWDIMDERAMNDASLRTWFTSNYGMNELLPIFSKKGQENEGRGIVKRIEGIVDGNVFSK